MEKPHSLKAAVKVPCDPGMDTCVEALGIGLLSPTTFQGCASTGSGFQPPEAMASRFNLNPNDVKKNGCMSKEEIQKKLKGFPSTLEGNIDAIKICFCDCGDCCNQGIKNDGSCSTCPIEEATEKSNAEKVLDAAGNVIDAAVDKYTSGVSSYVVAQDDIFLPSKIILIAYLLATLLG